MYFPPEGTPHPPAASLALELRRDEKPQAAGPASGWDRPEIWIADLSGMGVGRLSANAGGPLGAGTPWQAWMLLMSTHLDEAVYEAGRLDGPRVIVIDETGFRTVARSGPG